MHKMRAPTSMAPCASSAFTYTIDAQNACPNVNGPLRLLGIHLHHRCTKCVPQRQWHLAPPRHSPTPSMHKMRAPTSMAPCASSAFTYTIDAQNACPNVNGTLRLLGI